ncbi:MAG: hypothetical protein P4L81_08095 [Candidatus Pacebacteria bacterium]|nr:hypothetical protein [Candidatus Paceibacterota bacterium]
MYASKVSKYKQIDQLRAIDNVRLYILSDSVIVWVTEEFLV